MKTCSVCGTEKPLGQFHRSSRSKDGFRAQCKQCRKNENPERSREYSRCYARDNREVLKERRLDKYWEDPDKYREKARTYARENPGARLEYKKRYRKENQDNIREAYQKYYLENREHIIKRVSEYKKANRERYTSHEQVRRSRILGAPWEQINILEVFERDQWICKLCYEPVSRESKGTEPLSPTIDHIIPVSNENYPGHLWSNVQLAHRVCNISKGNRVRE